jgi:uncharacterized protein YvpB
MSRLSQAAANSGRTIRGIDTKTNVGVVIDVITNDEHHSIFDTGLDVENETKNTYKIGSVKIRKIDDVMSHPDQLRYYDPYDYSICQMDKKYIEE